MFRPYRPFRPSVGPIDADDRIGTIGINDGTTITMIGAALSAVETGSITRFWHQIVNEEHQRIVSK